MGLLVLLLLAVAINIAYTQKRTREINAKKMLEEHQEMFLANRISMDRRMYGEQYIIEKYGADYKDQIRRVNAKYDAKYVEKYKK